MKAQSHDPSVEQPPRQQTVVVTARPLVSIERSQAPTQLNGQAPPIDTLAIASAICGLTAIVPVLSQAAGVTLGVMSLRRIRRARRAGVVLRGRGWAAAGVILSGIALFGWVATFALLAWVGGTFANAASALP